jgi:hypothetical protein
MMRQLNMMTRQAQNVSTAASKVEAAVLAMIP